MNYIFLLLDGGGSIRIPAAFCSLSGLKPTAGRVPHRGYSATTNSVLGPLCHSVIDCAKIYAVIAGPDNHKESEITLYQPKLKIPRSIPNNLAGIQIGIDQKWNSTLERPDLVAIFRKEVNKLEKLGARIVPIAIPDLSYHHAAHALTFCTEIISIVRKHLGRQLY